MTSRARSVADYASTRALRNALAAVEEEPRKQDEGTTSSSAKMTRGSSQDMDDSSLNESWDWVLTNYDVGTTQPQSISQELHRLQVLKSYMILDADREEAFDRLTDMASRIFRVPIAVVSLVDLGRQWFLSNHGLGDVRETPRNLAFCAHAIQGRNDLLIVKETLDDPRFCQSALVLGAPFIRFYAGAPLISPEGYKLGTFCIIDTKPRPNGLSQDEQDNLKDFAAMAMKVMVDRRQIASQHDTAHLVACTAHDLLTPLMGVQLSLSLLEEEATSSMAEPHKEFLSNAIRSSDWLYRICQTTIETLRTEKKHHISCPLHSSGPSQQNLDSCTCGGTKGATVDFQACPVQSPFINMNEFVASLNQTMESIPKRVPLILTVHDSVPSRIVSDDLKLFRSSLNLISNALANTTTGSVQFHIYTDNVAPSQHGRRYSISHRPNFLVFECTDTGRELEVDGDELFKPKNDALGLFSVAFQIDSLGGSYGYRSRREIERKDGSVFWFQIPLLLPEDISVSGGPRLTGSTSASLNDDASVASLESSVIHYPSGAILSPALHQKHAITHHQPVPASLFVNGGDGLRCQGNRSFSNFGIFRDEQEAVNLSGMLAVAAAAMPHSNSCCELDELAQLGGSIEAFKARRQAKNHQTRPKAPTGEEQVSQPLRISHSSGAIGSVRSNGRRHENDNRNYRSNDCTMYRRTHTTGDSTRYLKAMLARRASRVVEASTVATDETQEGSHSEKAAHVETKQEVSPPNVDVVPVPTTIRIPRQDDTADPRLSRIVDKAIDSQARTFGKPRPLFDTASKSQAQAQEKSPSSLLGTPKTVSPNSEFQQQETLPKPLFDLAPKSNAHALESSQPGGVEIQLQMEEQEPQATMSTARQKRALVIEDTLVVRKTLTRALQKLGYEVTQANDGVEGLEALKSVIFDLTLCDFLMPNMDGLDCVQQYRQWEKANREFQQYIVGISAHVSQNDVDKGLEIGMNTFRPKPITIKTLTELDACAEMELVRATLSTLHVRGGTQDNRSPEPISAINGSAPTSRMTCLMATVRADGESGETARKMRMDGWDVTIVENGPSALEQLKSRNWGAVVLDDYLPTISGSECVEQFRVWESQNRVNRQDNLFIVCTDVVLSNPGTSLLPPAGFDGAVDRHVSWNSLQTLMEKQKGSQPSTRESLSIITR